MTNSQLPSGFTIESDPARCRVAYTINNWQPVMCTIIGDQPLFYMDSVETEDMSLDSGTLESLTLYLEQETGSAAADARRRYRSEEDQIAELRTAARALADTEARDEQTILALVRDALNAGLMGRAYAEFLDKNKIGFAVSPGLEAARYCRARGTVFVPAHMGDDDTVLSVFGEIRRAWQHKSGVLLDPMTFHPDQAVLVNRLHNADRAVATVRLAWDCKMAGRASVWERLTSTSLADVAQVLARSATRDFRTLSGGKAMLAAFEAWFLSERCRKHDRAIIQRMLADYKNYTQKGIAGSSLILATEVTGRIGDQPLGKNYLSGRVDQVVRDPIFTEVRDRSNANFLWFIKFEQSFTEAEQVLQPEQASTDVRAANPGASPSHLTESSGELITHPRFQRDGAVPAVNPAAIDLSSPSTKR